MIPMARSRPSQVTQDSARAREAPTLVTEGVAVDLRDSTEIPDPEEFLRALRTDYDRHVDIRTLRDHVLEQPHASTPEYRVLFGLLFRISTGYYQLVLPPESPLRELVMRLSHESAATGLTGRDKTLDRVTRRFWWRGVRRDVERWVASCETCQVVKPRSSYPDGLLQSHVVPERLWQVVSVDFITGLPTTDRHYDCIVTFTDKLSKMVHLVPLRFGDTTAESVARVYFDHVWEYHHGAPMKIVSDRDLGSRTPSGRSCSVLWESA